MVLVSVQEFKKLDLIWVVEAPPPPEAAAPVTGATELSLW